MEYYINGIALSTFGIIPGQQSDSDIAIAGHLDFPKRLGKAFHVWPDEPGIEPYVAESELRWEGRDIHFRGLMDENSDYAALQKLEAFYDLLNDLDELVTLSCGFGSWEVYVKEAVEVKHLSRGGAVIDITFRQPDCGITSVESGGVDAGIDGVDFEDFGFTYLRLDGQWNRPGTKEIKTINYLKEAYQVTKANAREMVLKGLFISSSYAAMKAKVDQLAEMLAKPGVRTLQISGEPFREFFCCTGFTVSQINVRGTVSAYIELRMMEVNRPVFNPVFLTDDLGNILLSEGQKIIIRL